jgi:hypothetical protein
LQPGLRTYTFLVEQGFVPAQTRLLPISTSAYEQFGFSTDTYTQSEQDARKLIADFRSATQTRWATSLSTMTLWVLLSMPLLIMLLVWYRSPGSYDAALTGIIVMAPWLYAWGTQSTPTIEPVVTVIICGALRILRVGAVRVGMIGSAAPSPFWIVALAVSCFSGTRALAVSHWMLGVDIAALTSWSAFFAYIVQMRAAFPIPLLAIEYQLTHTQIPFLFDVMYTMVFVRICAIAGIMAALSYIPAHSTNWRIAKYGALLLLSLGVAFIYRYDDRNYWMAYDACIGLALISVFLLLRGKLERPSQWLMLGAAIVAADSLRPYMQFFLPILLIAGALQIGTRHGWRGLRWYLIPFIYSITWHLHHIIWLEQWSWSNYTGFNIARAWLPEFYAQAVIGLPPDMNNPEWGVRSSALTRASIAWITSHPWQAIGNALALLWQMVQIPVTIERFNGTGGTYEVMRAIPWFIPPFRVLVGGVLIAQLVVLLHDVRRRPTEWQHRTFERVIWITIFCLTALSEKGEQARFVASYIPLLFLGWLEIAIIPDWNAVKKIVQNIFRRSFWKNI